MSQIRVKDQFGNGLGGIPIRVAEGNNSSESAPFDYKTNDDGSQTWPIPFWPQQRYTLYVNDGPYAQPTFSADSRAVDPPFQDVDFTLTRTGAAHTTTEPRVLHRDGNDLKDPDGRIVRLEGATFFPAHWLLLEKGKDAILPSVREVTSRYGVNCFVLFGMSVNVQRNLFGADPFDPSKYGQAFFDTLRELFSVFAEHGAYGYYVAFPDHGLIPAFDNDAKCIDHWNKLLDVFRTIPNVLLKPTNEGASKGYNYINPHLLQFPDFCPVAACDYGVDDPAYATGDWPDGYDWGGDRTFGDLHPPRGGTATVLDCTAVNNIYYKHNRGLAISEPIRMGSNGSGGVTREIARLVGLASRVGTLMRVFHSLQGEKCEVFDDTTRDHADAFFTGQ